MRNNPFREGFTEACAVYAAAIILLLIFFFVISYAAQGR